MRIEPGLVAIGALAFGGLQDQPSPVAAPGNMQDSQIVVIAPDDAGIDTRGPVPVLRGGEWRFERSAQLSRGESSNEAAQRIPGAGGSTRRFGFSVCLPDDSLEAALQRLAGDRSTMPNPSQFCGRLRVDAGKGRIGGRRTCQLPSRQIGTSHSNLNLRLSGRYDARAMTINVYAEEQTDGIAEGQRVPRPATYSWRVGARRVGHCPGTGGTVRSLDEAADLLFVPGADDSGI